MKKGRSKFFFCFRPVVIDDVSGDPALPCTAVGGGGKESAVITNIFKSLPDKNLKESSVVDASSADVRCRKSKSSRRLTRLLKAVLIDISLSKKFRNRKSRKKSFQSKSDLSSKSDKLSNSMNEKSASFTETSDTDDTLRINSTRSSSLFSSSTNDSSSLSFSCNSSISSNSRSYSERKGLFQVDSNQTPNEAYGFYCPTIILCLFLLCLLVLICWGRIFAILSTLACFFLCSRRFQAVNSPLNGGESPVNVDSEECKKRVIMDGLLDRDRSRRLL